ncbi:MAG: tetratricopeptide repeat protein [Deltaproteobacteria bacterium]|nr:tetratricopeptide repeat protein [Candidatus Anaeroferrophillacea bacterium]
MTGPRSEGHRGLTGHGVRLAVLLVALWLLAGPGAIPVAAAEKELRSVKIGSFADKTRVVLRLTGEGFYEVRQDADRVIVNLYGFVNLRVPPRQVVDERLISTVTVQEEDDRLAITVALRAPILDYHAGLFGSPPVLVLDLFPRTVAGGPDEAPETSSPAGGAGVAPAGRTDEEAAAGGVDETAAPAESAAVVPEPPAVVISLAGDVPAGTGVLPAAEAPSVSADGAAVSALTAAGEASTSAAAADPPAGRVTPADAEALPAPGVTDIADVEAVPASPSPDDVPPPVPAGSLSAPTAEAKRGDTTVVPVDADAASPLPGVHPLPAPEYRAPAGTAPKTGAPAETAVEGGGPVLAVVGTEALPAAAAGIPAPAAVHGSPGDGTAVPGTAALPSPEPVPGPREQRRDDAAATLYDEGLRLYHEGNFDAAVERFTTLIREVPASPLVPGARFRISDARARQAAAEQSPDVHRAINDYLAVVRRFPEHEDAPWAWLQVGRLYESLGFSYEADGVYEIVLRQYPDSEFAAAARLRAARLNYRMERWGRAAVLFAGIGDDDAAGDDTFRAEARYYEANSHCREGDYGRARKLYETALKRFPVYPTQDAESLYLIGACYQQVGELPRAREYLLTVRNLFPEHRLTNLALTRVGDTLIAEGSLLQGLAVLSTVIREYPETDGALLARLSLARIGERENLDLAAAERETYEEFLDSAACYRQVVARGGADNPLAHIARLRLGQLHYRRREYAAARRELDLLFEVDIDPQLRGPALETMRDVLHDELEGYYRKGDYTAMIALQDRYGRTFLPRPDRLYPYLWLADAMRRQGLYQGAVELYVPLAACDPDLLPRLEIGWGMAFCHLKLGDPAAAAAVLAPLLAASLPRPWDYRLRLLQADALAARGERDAALELLAELRRHHRAADRLAVLLIRMGMLQQEAGRPAAAIAILEEAVALTTDNPALVSRSRRAVLAASLGRLYYAGEAGERALRWFREAALLEDDPATVAELLYWQGAALARLDRLAELERLLETMRATCPDSPWTNMTVDLLQEKRWRAGSR